jgi:diguanylate cyclase
MAQAPIELGLFRPERVRSKALLALVRDLLHLIGEAAPESDDLDTTVFRRDLQRFAAEIEAAPDEQALERIAAACVERCSDYFRKAQERLSERDTELSALLAVVEQLVAAVAGDARSMDEQLACSSDRLTRIVEINDLRILKRRLSLELTTLRRVIDEQRDQHERQREHMTAEVGRLQKRLVRAREEASIDPLTRVGNRARFDRALKTWVEQHRKSGVAFVLAMIDLDNFKDVNDRWGHPTGDHVLVDTAAVLAGAVRPTDVVARFGGDEFVVMISGATFSQAESRFGEMLGQISTVRVPAPTDDGPALVISASIGFTEFDVADSAAEILGRADRALYDAKNAGKGSVRSLRRAFTSKLFQNGRPVAGVPASSRK